MKYIYHHLGLGDHIICNGMVRHFCEIYGQVSIFCKPHNLVNVSYMYRDNNKIHVLPIGDDGDIIVYINDNNIQNDVITVGFGELNQNGGNTFDESFYKSKNLPFDYRFSKFYFQRDLNTELSIYNELNPTNEPYIFLHGVSKDKIKNDIKIIENPNQYKIFDLLTLIENASEVHLMESSIKNLINSYKFNKPKFFYHQYVRGYPQFNNTQGLNYFEIIK